ncbi:peroxidase family protein [Marinomonas sp. THO17]|uniref:peroxidase family protein n=1 Tax=Marinomonas sp. THO17 TaxID=3149048 RepID=UPI00336C1411
MKSSLLIGLLRIVNFFPLVTRLINRIVSNQLATATTARPNSYSLWSPVDKKNQPPSSYLTWHTVTNKSFFDLHLSPAEDSFIKGLPSNDGTKEYPFGQVTELFKRENGLKEGRSSVFFMFFAQWFTDGFFRSDHIDLRKTTSNHNIDLAQIYGPNEEVALMLRSGSKGKLKSQIIDGEEYPDYLGELNDKGEWQVKECYERLPYIADKDWMESIFGNLTTEQKTQLFATGLERGNSIIGHMVMSTLFLREHNNICDNLSILYPDWDDDRLFHTARIINTVVLMKLVIEDYVNHIAGVDVLIMDPSYVEKKDWYREPWIAAEFNLLYRWHGLVPDALEISGRSESFVQNFSLLTQEGLSNLLEAATQQAAGQITLDNVPAFLMPAEQSMINKGRDWQLRSYNDYREKFGLQRLDSFEQLSHNSTINKELEKLYGHIDKLEFTVGLFAEDSELTLTGGLQTAMVAYDAITQIYTNPLLARQNYTEEHFTSFGMERIEETKSFQELVDRNTQRKVTVSVNNQSMTS